MQQGPFFQRWSLLHFFITHWFRATCKFSELSNGYFLRSRILVPDFYMWPISVQARHGALPKASQTSYTSKKNTRPPSCYRVYVYLGIRRRRACLGMPTDGGRWCWYVGVSWNVVKYQWYVSSIQKTYHMSDSQICLSLFLNFSIFVGFCVLAYVVEKHASACLRNGGRLNLCSDDVKVVW